MVLFLAPDLSHGQLTLQQATCDASRRRVDVHMSGANVVLGGLFAISETGTKGQGCGLPSKGLRLVFFSFCSISVFFSSIPFFSSPLYINICGLCVCEREIEHVQIP